MLLLLDRYQQIQNQSSARLIYFWTFNSISNLSLVTPSIDSHLTSLKMASERHEEYFPTNRTDNILNDGPQYHEHGYAEDEIEELEDSGATLAHTSSSTDNNTATPTLTRSGTTRSDRLSRRNTFEEINAGDRAALHRLATEYGGTEAALSRVGTRASGLERQDTLAGIQTGDPVLDPKSPFFDVYKWARMVRLSSNCVF